MLKPKRAQMAKEQHGLCPITKRPLGDDIVLDHCHTTGMIRAVLPRWINAILGRIENWSARAGKGIDQIALLRGIADYIEFHQRYPTGILHPTHRTEAEKRDLKNKRARAARQKANIEKRRAAKESE
jgi:hypothetical protein